TSGPPSSASQPQAPTRRRGRSPVGPPVRSIGSERPTNDQPGESKGMSEQDEYAPPRGWTWDKASGGRFANINRPVAGPTHEKELPVGRHPLQLYSLATPNGGKVTVMIEELLAAGHS